LLQQGAAAKPARIGLFGLPGAIGAAHPVLADLADVRFEAMMAFGAATRRGGTVSRVPRVVGVQLLQGLAHALAVIARVRIRDLLDLDVGHDAVSRWLVRAAAAQSGATAVPPVLLSHCLRGVNALLADLTRSDSLEIFYGLRSLERQYLYRTYVSSFGLSNFRLFSISEVFLSLACV